jgi:23S rRNA (pseudouridine1915-N3)-methyltransferase
MNINIIAASLIKDVSINSLINEYKKRLSIIKLSVTQFDDKNLKKDQINKKIFELCPSSSYKILLDEKGKLLSTNDLNKFLLKIPNKEISFLIGGADGFNDVSRANADTIISLSPLTFPHQIARLILIEQIYRMQTLITNHPYHRN